MCRQTHSGYVQQGGAVSGGMLTNADAYGPLGGAQDTGSVPKYLSQKVIQLLKTSANTPVSCQCQLVELVFSLTIPVWPH